MYINKIQEWKPMLPISSVHSPPLLIQDSSSLGPLFFNPIPDSLSHIFSSSYLCPPILLPPPHLSLNKFLETSSVLPTIASSISSSSFHSQHNHKTPNIPLRNRLEPLYCPNNQLILFFPTGSNLDCVGFLVLSVKDSKLAVDFCSEGSVLTSQMKFDHQIIQLTACPSSDSSIPNVGGSTSPCVGFLLACNMYAANWFSVLHNNGNPLDSKNPAALVFMGSKKFKTSMVAHACWNPHLTTECVVLLKSGALFLFDMDSCSKTRFGGKRISVSWDEPSESANSGWFSCEFSWHPRILVVGNIEAIYVLDLRFGKCQHTCLLRLGVNDLAEKHNFVLLSKAGIDGFLYTVASDQWLFLCDIRKPQSPLLKWAHNLNEPRYMTVLPLSEMRSFRDDVHAEASAIILGSLWNNEFCFFCYGRQAPSTTSTNSSYENFNLYLSNSFYAWELPSAFLVSAQDCPCADCLINEEFSKDDLPEWIAWQSKRQLALGFFILRKNLRSLLPEIGEDGGFTLVRLMSNGTLQSQQYCASWEMTSLTKAHGETSRPFRDSLLCSIGDEEYKYRRRFYYIKFENLYVHLNDKIGKSMFTKFISSSAGRLCEYEPPVSHLDVDVFMDVNMPASLYEIVSRLMWTALPINVLKAAFPEHSEVVAINCKRVPPEFPVIPDGNQLPPFFLKKPSSGCSHKQGEDIVGPVLPLSVSLVLKEISKHGNSFAGQLNDFSTEHKFTRLCEYVVNFTKNKFSDDVNKKQDKDLEEIWVDDSAETGRLLLYKPTSFMDEVEEQKYSELEKRYNTIVAKSAQDDTDFFGGLCPIELKFDSDSKNEKLMAEKSSSFKMLKKQFLHWQNGFKPYKEFCMKLQQDQQSTDPAAAGI